MLVLCGQPVRAKRDAALVALVNNNLVLSTNFPSWFDPRDPSQTLANAQETGRTPGYGTRAAHPTPGAPQAASQGWHQLGCGNLGDALPRVHARAL